jgi:azurin
MWRWKRSLLGAGLALSGAAAYAQAPATIEITANDQMKYSIESFEVAAGKPVRIVLRNAGTLPREAMSHNLIILKPGTDPLAFATAGITLKETDYVAPDKAELVLFKTKTLGPGEQAVLEFTAPAAGEYPYVCTFPGHAALMKGVMKVK